MTDAPHVTPDTLWSQLNPGVMYMSVHNQNKVKAALEYAFGAHQHQKRKSGEPYILHPVAVAEILAELKLDPDTVVAGLLHDTIEDTEATGEDIGKLFGHDVRRIVEGETKVSKLYKFAQGQDDKPAEERHAEDLRQMFIAMAEDARIIVVKLADRLHNLRTMQFMPEHKQKRIARETLDIYAPLAHRLGIGQVKLELEDLSLKYLEPQSFAQLERELASHDQARQGAVGLTQDILQQALAKDFILKQLVRKIEVTGRSKHLYSIWKKMQKDQKSISQIYDLLALRVVLNTIPADTPEEQLMREKQVCYHVLGLVHALWQPIPGRVKDYIAVPKLNGYQSLHTTVIAVNGLPLEVQIRTADMHQIAEYGVAAHWAYKEGKTNPEDLKKSVGWLGRISEWQSEYADSREFVDAITNDLLAARVYVFTPKGKIINLPKGATAVDFAYHIHTQVGHQMIGAKINNRMVSFGVELRNGDIVEIMTSKQGKPSQDWINFAKTRSAKQKIRVYFKEHLHHESADKGQKLLERYFKRRGAPKPLNAQLEEAAKKLIKTPSLEELYGALGLGRVTPSQIAKVLAPKTPVVKKVKPVNDDFGVRLADDLTSAIRLSNCCNPSKGDVIVGYITRGRGVSIHRRDCLAMRRVLERDAARVIAATWSGLERVMQLEVLATDRAGLLRDVMDVIASMGKSAMGVNSNPTPQNANVFKISTKVDLTEGEQQSLSKRLSEIDHVFDVQWSLIDG